MVTPGSVKKVSAGNKKVVPVKRRVYQATLDKLHNLGNFTSERRVDSQNNHNVNNDVTVESSVILLL